MVYVYGLHGFQSITQDISIELPHKTTTVQCMHCIPESTKERNQEDFNPIPTLPL